MNRIIYNYLASQGIKQHLAGFELLSDAIEMCIRYKSRICDIQGIYTTLSKKYNCTEASVDHKLRYAIKNRINKDRHLSFKQFISKAVYDITLESWKYAVSNDNMVIV